MGKPKKKKGKIRIKTGARMKRKSEQAKDTLKKVQGRPPADVAPTFRIKIKKKV